MGKILLIEPDKILKQAISLSLFPEHEVEESSSGSIDNNTLKEYDLLIVDGSALSERNYLTPEFTRTIRRSDIPTIWLEDDESSRPFVKDKLLFVKKPIERETFQSALNSFLSPKTPKKAGGVDAAPREREKQTKGQQKEFHFIELSEVVDEQAPTRKSGKSK